MEKYSNNKSHASYFIISFFIIFILSFFVLFFVEKQIRSAKIEEIELNELSVVNLQKDFLGREFSIIISDLHYLHHAYEFKFEDENNYKEIAENWIEFSTHRGIYDQIRFIDAKGDEKIRINLEADGERSYVVEPEKLQNKSDRYYFYETVKIKEEEVYVSPLDLNIEQDSVELPYKPMIRFSTPVYNEKDELVGIVVINYLADNVLKAFRHIAQNSDGEIMLLNSQGYLLSGKDENDLWNFMFEDRKGKSFANEHPKMWEALKQGNNQMIIEDTLFTFATVRLMEKFDIESAISGVYLESDAKIHLGGGDWYIVSLVGFDQDAAFCVLKGNGIFALDVLKQHMVYFIFIILISAILGFLIYLNRKTYTKIKYYSEYDALTKVLNRRAGIEKLNLLFPSDDRRHFIVSLCFIDINGLKQVNDTLGHKYGDELISIVADTIKLIIREYDFVMRLGGDEFLIVFNGIGSEMSEKVWGRIMTSYEYVNEHENRPYIISVSHGIIEYDNREKSHIDELINKADEKMYVEKQIIKADLNVIRYEIEND